MAPDGLIKVKRKPVPNKAGTGYTKKNSNQIIQGPFKTANEIAQTLNLDPKDPNSFESLLDGTQSIVLSLLKRLLMTLKTIKYKILPP